MNLDTRRKVCREVRRLRPEVIVAPDPSRLWYGSEYVNHWDHKQAGLLALTVVMPDAPTRPMFPELLDEGLEPFEVPNLWLATADADAFIDISDTIDTKIEALVAHVSQGAAEAGRASANAPKPLRRCRRRGIATRRGSRPSGSLTTRKGARWMSGGEAMDESFPVPEEPFDLTEEERADIEADLSDLAQMHSIFSVQGVKGVVIACQECRQNHFYEWALLTDNLQHMLDTGEPRMHEPAWDIDETEYIQWDYGKGFVDALVDNGIEPGPRRSA